MGAADLEVQDVQVAAVSGDEIHRQISNYMQQAQHAAEELPAQVDEFKRLMRADGFVLVGEHEDTIIWRAPQPQDVETTGGLFDRAWFTSDMRRSWYEEMLSRWIERNLRRSTWRESRQSTERPTWRTSSSSGPSTTPR